MHSDVLALQELVAHVLLEFRHHGVHVGAGHGALVAHLLRDGLDVDHGEAGDGHAEPLLLFAVIVDCAFYYVQWDSHNGSVLLVCGFKLIGGEMSPHLVSSRAVLGAALPMALGYRSLRSDASALQS